MAFTLSETLIALVIIGIIAAITVPAISRASEKYILKNQFKKTYSTMLNAINKADADMGGNTLCYYANESPAGSARMRDDCPAFFEQMISNLNVMKVCKGNAKAAGCIPTPWLKAYTSAGGLLLFFQSNIETNSYVYDLADGTIVVLNNYAGGTSYSPLFLVDINGSKGPNENGKDVFLFLISRNGTNGLRFFNQIVVTDFINKGYFSYLSDIFKEN